MPAAEMKPLGIDERRAATNQQARPVPYVAGSQRVGITWLANAFNVRATPIKQKIGKKKTVTGYAYSCGCAGLLGTGPLDSVVKILFDSEEVWAGELLRAGDSGQITIPDRGTLTLYWGTETQTADPDLLSSGENHPAYRGLAYFVFASLQLGQNRTQTPSIEFVVTRHPSPSWLTAPAEIEGDAQAPAVIYELLTSRRFGLGWSDDRIDLNSFDAVATILAAEGLGISPLITRQSTARELLVEALAYVDGFLVTTPEGKLGLDLVRPIADPGALIEITEADLLDVPEISPGSWASTHNETFVSFTNRESQFQEDSISWLDPGNFAITAERKPQTLARPWCTRGEMAQAIAAAAGAVDGLPAMSGALSVRRSAGAVLTVGQAIRLTYARLGIEQMIVRIVSRSIPSPGKPEVRLTWRIDRADNSDPALFAPAVDTPPATPTHDPEPNQFERILEAPYGLPSADLAEQVLILAARGSAIATGFNVHRAEPSGSFSLVGDSDRFAVRGHLVEAYSGGTETIDFDAGLLIEIDSVDSTFEARSFEDALTGEILLLVNDEILIPFDWELVSPSTWRASAIRGRFDTVRQDHAIDSPVWILERARAAVIDSKPALPVQSFKLQPFSINREVALADVDAVDLVTDFRARRPLRPLNLALDEKLSAASYSTGADFSLSWSTAAEARGPFWSLWGGGVWQNLPATVLEFRNTGGDLVRSVVLDPGVDSYVYANATLQADFGGEPDLIVRAYHLRDSYRSTHFAELSIQAL